jgi:hypothetical protein
MTPPFPELVVAGLAALREFYGDGRKMAVRRCLECGWDAGFYFDEGGKVRYDPGCGCTGNMATKESDEGWIALTIMRSHKWLKRRLDEGRWWEERKLAAKAWKPLEQTVEQRQDRREKIRRERRRSEMQGGLFV